MQLSKLRLLVTAGMLKVRGSRGGHLFPHLPNCAKRGSSPHKNSTIKLPHERSFMTLDMIPKAQAAKAKIDK